MGAERLFTSGEAAQVNDPLYSRPKRRCAKVARRQAIFLEVVAVRPHRVHQVISDIDAGEGAVKRRRIEEIARDDLRRRCDARRQRRRVPGETAKPNARGLENRHEPSPDIPRRARERTAGGPAPEFLEPVDDDVDLPEAESSLTMRNR